MMKKLGKKLMKKPAAAMKKMKTKTKKRSACIKRPAMTSAAVKQRRWRENARARQKARENVLAQARRAARNGLPYQTRNPKLAGVAAAAYAAEANSRKAMERADSAHERADSAHEAADSARQAADEAKKDAADARAIGLENHKRITLLVGEVKTGLDSWAETAALAKRNAERLDTDDRKRGYKTPDRRF